MTSILLIANTIMTAGILVGVWWGVIASKGGDLKEVAKSLRAFVEKNFPGDGK